MLIGPNHAQLDVLLSSLSSSLAAVYSHYAGSQRRAQSLPPFGDTALLNQAELLRCLTDLGIVAPGPSSVLSRADLGKCFRLSLPLTVGGERVLDREGFERCWILLAQTIYRGVAQPGSVAHQGTSCASLPQRGCPRHHRVTMLII